MALRGDDYQRISWREMMGLVLNGYIPFRLLGSMRTIACLLNRQPRSFG